MEGGKGKGRDSEFTEDFKRGPKSRYVLTIGDRAEKERTKEGV